MTFNELLATLATPAKRALSNNGIDNFEKLAQLTKEDILLFHGIGPSSIPKLENALESVGKKFKIYN